MVNQMVINPNFTELSNEEVMQVEGGFAWGAIIAPVVKAATVTGAACGLGPVGGGIVLGACVVALGVGIYAATR